MSYLPETLINSCCTKFSHFAYDKFSRIPSGSSLLGIALNVDLNKRNEVSLHLSLQFHQQLSCWEIKTKKKNSNPCCDLKNKPMPCKYTVLRLNLTNELFIHFSMIGNSQRQGNALYEHYKDARKVQQWRKPWRCFEIPTTLIVPGDETGN